MGGAYEKNEICNGNAVDSDVFSSLCMVRWRKPSYQRWGDGYVVFEKPGVIALRFKEGEEDKAKIEVYFDPVSLKDTKTLSVVDLKMPKDGVDKKTAVLNATITLSGPVNEVEA